MLAYIYLILFVILLGLIYYVTEKREKLIWIIMVVLILFAGLRGTFTSDHARYLQYFHQIIENESFSSVLSEGLFSTERPLETGFMLLNLIIGYFSESDIVYTTVIISITLFFYFSAFKRFSVDPWLSILLFVTVGDYFASFNLMRHILAASICFWATKFIEENKMIKYFIWILVASTIHITSLIMIPMYFVLKIHINLNNTIIQAFFAIILWFALPKIIAFSQSNISKYDNYTYGMNEGVFNAVIPSLGVVLFAIFSIKLFSNTFEYNNIKSRISINASCWAVFILSLCLQTYIVFRLAFFLKPYICVLASNTISLYRDKREKLIIVLAICLVSLLYTYITLSGTGYDPYYFAWENMQTE